MNPIDFAHIWQLLILISIQQALTWDGASVVLRGILHNNSTVARLNLSCISFCDLVVHILVKTKLFCARSARALIKAEAEVENKEKLGEAAMQFFYGNKVLIFWHGGGPGP